MGRLYDGAQGTAAGKVQAGTPTQIIALLHREIVRLVALADVQKRLDDLGFEMVANTPEAFAAEIKQKTEQWSKVIGNAKVKVDWQAGQGVPRWQSVPR